MPPRRDTEALLEDLRRVHAEVSGVVSANDYREHGDFGATTLIRRFGSFKAAREAAEIESEARVGPSEEQLLSDIRAVDDELDKPVSIGDYREAGNHGLQTVRDRFGSFDAARKAAGIDGDPRQTPRVSEEDILEDIQQVTHELGEPPSARQYNTHGDYSASLARDQLGKYTTARAEADVADADHSKRGGHNRIGRDELLNALHELADDLGRPPKREEMLDQGRFSESPYRTEFGSWNAALEAAGYDLHRPTEAERIEQDCAECATTVEKRAAEVEHQQRVFCSPECVGTWYGRQRPTTTVTVECDWCTTSLERRPCDIESNEHVFCDYDCYSEWCSAERRGEAHPRYTDYPDVECDVCGEVFSVRPANLETARFCSYDCLGTYRESSMAGEDNPNWEGGDELYYGPQWHRQRRRCLARDDYTCQSCGTENAAHRDKHGFGLHVHHVKPVREFIDEAEANERPDYQRMNALDNLVTLCIGCHNTWEAFPIRPEVGN